MSKKLIRKNLLEQLLRTLPFLTSDQILELFLQVAKLSEKHEVELSTNQEIMPSMSEPENEFTRNVCGFFISLPPELKAYFINDVLQLIKTYSRLCK